MTINYKDFYSRFQSPELINLYKHLKLNEVNWDKVYQIDAYGEAYDLFKYIASEFNLSFRLKNKNDNRIITIKKGIIIDKDDEFIRYDYIYNDKGLIVKIKERNIKEEECDVDTFQDRECYIQNTVNTILDYDDKDRLIYSNELNGLDTYFHYKDDKLVKIDGRHDDSELFYDDRGRLIKELDKSGHNNEYDEIYFTYDDNDNLISIKKLKNVITNFVDANNYETKVNEKIEYIKTPIDNYLDYNFTFTDYDF
jgi:YD repeat-containing protein